MGNSLIVRPFQTWIDLYSRQAGFRAFIAEPLSVIFSEKDANQTIRQSAGELGGGSMRRPYRGTRLTHDDSEASLLIHKPEKTDAAKKLMNRSLPFLSSTSLLLLA